MKHIIVGILFGLSFSFTAAQNCKLPATSDWNSNELTSDIQNAVAFGLTKTGDAFVAEMLTGNIKHYKQSSGQTVNLGSVDTELYVDEGGVIENGLLGVAPDPDFETNQWIYTLYSRQMSNNSTTDCRRGTVYDHKVFLVRFTVANDKLTNPKDLLSFQRWSTSHAAGGITFDRKGHMYITTGDDTNPFSDNGTYGPRGAQGPCSGRPIEEVKGVDAQGSAGNTNDLRGKSLRIIPLPFADSETPAEGVGSTYEIPEGNLFDEALDTDDKTRPEIYSMGHRNPYRARVDSITGWVMIGEVGPDADSDRNEEPRGHDEFNLVKEPGNFGWPYANANNRAYRVQSTKEGSDKVVGEYFDLENLTNTSPNNTGLTNLPPAQPALGWYNSGGSQTGPSNAFGGGGESAIGGPRYWYHDGDPNRMPPYFQGKYIVGDWVRNKLWVLDVDANGELRKVENFGKSVQGSVIDIDMGPGGVLYVLYSGPGYGGWQGDGHLIRYEYTGNQYDISECAGIIVENTGLTTEPIAFQNSSVFNTQLMHFQAGINNISVPKGAEKLTLYDVKGSEVYSATALNDQKFVQVQGLKEGVYLAKFLSK